MIFCPNCGKQLPENNSNFCPYCGNPITASSPPTNNIPQQPQVNIANNADKDIIKIFFNWTGRLNRQPYNIICISLTVLNMIFYAIFGFEMDSYDTADIVIAVLLLVPIITIAVSTISLTVRRLHDLNLSGWWAFLNIIPIVNFIFSLLLVFKKGTTGPNHYGPDPLLQGGKSFL